MLTRRGCLGRLVAGIAALVGLRAATTPKVRDWMMNVTPAATLPDLSGVEWKPYYQAWVAQVPDYWYTLGPPQPTVEQADALLAAWRDVRRGQFAATNITRLYRSA